MLILHFRAYSLLRCVLQSESGYEQLMNSADNGLLRVNIDPLEYNQVVTGHSLEMYLFAV